MNDLFISDLKQSILYDCNKFINEHPDDNVYGVAIVMGQEGNYLGLAFASEKGLSKVANEYLHYRNATAEQQRLYSSIENLKLYFRWANPDDGWEYIDFSKQDIIDLHLKEIIKSNKKEIDEEIKRCCIKALQEKEFQKFFDNIWDHLWCGSRRLPQNGRTY